MFRNSRTTEDRIEVSDRVLRRARQVPAGAEPTWIEGTMAQIGSAVTHHRPGEPLDDAIMGAEAVLALLHEMRRREG